MGWNPQVAHTAAVEVRTPLTVESPVGGVQYMGDPQLPQLKSVVCRSPGKGRKGVGFGLSPWVEKKACLTPALGSVKP